MSITDLISFLVAIGILITLHEWGHFWVARCAKIKTRRFSIGFGKPIKRFFGKDGTEYSIGWLPLGGYVQMLDGRELNRPLTPNERQCAFDHQPLLIRFAVIAAGPIVNILFAVCLYWFIFLIGIQTVKPIVGKIAPHSIAARAGLRQQESIIAVDGHKTEGWRDVILAIAFRLGEKGHLLIDTQTQTKQHHYRLNIDNWSIDSLQPQLLTSLGIKPHRPPTLGETKKYGFTKALSQAIHTTTRLIKFNFILIGKLITGRISFNTLGGPLSIFKVASQAWHQGILIYLQFLAVISIMLGCINLLPIPALDGGHLLFLAIESIRRRPMTLAMQLLATRLGIILLVVLMFHATVNDLLRL